MNEQYKQEPESQTDKQAKVFTLTVELADVTAKKKSVVAAYNDEIKRIKGEIKDLVSPSQETFEVI